MGYKKHLTKHNQSKRKSFEMEEWLMWVLGGLGLFMVSTIILVYFGVRAGAREDGVKWRGLSEHIGENFIPDGKLTLAFLALGAVLVHMWIMGSSRRKEVATKISYGIGITISALLVGIILLIAFLLKQPVDISPSSPSVDSPGIHNVKGHWRGGKWIDGYQRSNPDGIESNNLNQ